MHRKQMEKQLQQLERSIWNKGYDGCFYGRVNPVGIRDPIFIEGSLFTVLSRCMEIAKTLYYPYQLFPFRISTSWNNKNTGTIEVEFLLDASPEREVFIRQMYLQRYDQQGNITREKLVCPVAKTIPLEKSTVVTLMNPQQKIDKKNKGKTL